MADSRQASQLKKPVSLFVASTPLQLISCSEARRYFSPERSLLLLARPGNASTEQHMRNLLAVLGWQNSEIIFLGRRLSYLSLAWLLHRLRRLDLETLYIGYKGSWVHEVLVRALPARQVIYLDDGIATITDYWKLRHGSSESAVNHRQLRWLRYFGIKLAKASSKHHYFTIFPLPDCPEVAITHNDLSLFRAAFPSQSGKSPSSVAAFIGQPLTKDPDYLRSVRHQLVVLQSRYADCRIVYYMHRKENRRTLEQTFSGCKVDIVLPDMPFEVEMARLESRPIALYSLMSTALFTVKLMIPEISAFYIPDQNLAKKVRYYNEIIAVMEAVGVQCAELPDLAINPEKIEV